MGEPVKFEAGMVVRFALLERDADRALLMRRINDKHLTCDALDDETQIFLLSRIGYAGSAHVISPAPRAGDTWTSGESVACIESDGAQLRIVSEREPFVGDVVAVARKLWEGGYRMARRMPTFEELFARDPVAQALVKQMERDALRRAASAVPDRTRITHANVDGRTAPVARTLRDGRTAYVTLEGMKECAPASLSAFDGTWPVFTPSAEVDGGIHPTREGVERVIERLRAAEMVWLDAKQHVAAAPAHVTLDDMDTLVPTYEEQTSSAAMFRQLQNEADVEVARIILGNEAAEKMRAEQRQTAVAAPTHWTLDVGKGFSVTLPPLSVGSYTLSMDPETGTAELRGADGVLPGVTVLREAQARVDAATPQSLLDGIVERLFPRRHDGARPCDPPLDKSCALCAKGDDLRKLAEVFGVSELRAGMVVRENVAQPAWGVVRAVRERSFTLRWSCGTMVHHDRSTFDSRVQSGHWRIVAPDVAPLASLAHAVAAVFAPCDRATSRQHVDLAVARLRGEPFAGAIEAALVGVSERANLTPAEIAATIAALRHWEARRPFGVALRPEAHASLSRSSAETLRSALGYAPVWDTDLLFSTYERARSSR